MHESLQFAETARVAGVKWAQLKGWLDRSQVKLDAISRHDGVSPRQFSPTDLLRIALIGQLVRHGISMRRASEIVEACFDFDRMSKARVTISEMAKRFELFTLVVWLDPAAGGWIWAMEPRHTAPADVPCTVRLKLSLVAREVAARLAAQQQEMIDPDAKRGTSPKGAPLHEIGSTRAMQALCFSFAGTARGKLAAKQASRKFGAGGPSHDADKLHPPMLACRPHLRPKPRPSMFEGSDCPLDKWRGKGRPGPGWDNWEVKLVPLADALEFPVGGEA